MNENYVTLGQVCAKGSSNIAQKDLAEREGQYPIYGAAGLIKNVDFAHQKQPYIAVVKDGAGIGRVMKLPAYSSVIGTMQYIFPKENVDIDYLFYALQHMNLGKYFSGSTIPHIYFRDYQKERLKLPVMKVQQRQADTLSRIDALSAYGQRQIALMDEIVKSRFVEMFEKGEFERIPFDSFCEFLRNGASIKQTKGAGGYPITRIETLANDTFNIDRLGYANITELKGVEKYILQKGDILISHINSVAYLGRAVQYRGESNTPIIHGMNLLCARLRNDCNSTYVEYFFKTPMAKDYISTITKKAVNQASITTTDLKKMPIPDPPLELQNRFSAFVAEVDKSKFRIQKSLSTSRKLWTLARIDAIMNMDFSTQRSL